MYFFFFFNDTATTEIYTLSLHDALPISHVMVGFGNNLLARMEGLLSSCRATDSQVADSDIHTGYPCMSFRCGIGSLDFQGDEQIKLFPGFVVPELSRSDSSTLLDESHVLAISGIGDHHAPIQ